MQTADNVIRRDMRGSLHLRQEFDRTHNRSGNELREEGNKQSEIHKLAYRRDTSPIDVHRVADALEGVKADAERQNDFPGPGRHLIIPSNGSATGCFAGRNRRT